MNLITLTTDFGVSDWFVGAMKGVILGLNPRATVVDNTHGIPSGDVRAGAFALLASYRCFPRRTIHVAVVDPGVGSDRPAIAALTADYAFVGPDNGVLSLALSREKILTVRRLANPRYFRQPASQTFHGRDIFAPVAARLSRGLDPRRLGPEWADWFRLPFPQPVKQRAGIQGKVVYLDRFGNAITNLPNDLVAEIREAMVWLRGKPVAPVRSCYQAVPPGRAVAVPGSTGCLEIAINGGSAAARLRLSVGDTLLLRACFKITRGAAARDLGILKQALRPMPRRADGALL
jgi:S-adenosylmethionine hydrolase